MSSPVEVSGVDEAQTLESLRSFVGANCVPSPDSIAALAETDLVLFSGQFFGAGKSTFGQVLELDGRLNIASWTNRDLRRGEVEGVDKCKKTIGQLAAAAQNGELLELEEVRPGMFYATPAKLDPSKRYIKDLELKGALRLREYAPELPIVVPVPPLHQVGRTTEWERRLVLRERYDQAIGDKAFVDLQGRLEGVVEEADRIVEENLADDPNLVIIVNDVLPVALDAMKTFLVTGEKPHNLDIPDYLTSIKSLAVAALAT